MTCPNFIVGLPVNDFHVFVKMAKTMESEGVETKPSMLGVTQVIKIKGRKETVSW